VAIDTRRPDRPLLCRVGEIERAAHAVGGAPDRSRHDVAHAERLADLAQVDAATPETQRRELRDHEEVPDARHVGRHVLREAFADEAHVLVGLGREQREHGDGRSAIGGARAARAALAARFGIGEQEAGAEALDELRLEARQDPRLERCEEVAPPPDDGVLVGLDQAHRVDDVGDEDARLAPFARRDRFRSVGHLCASCRVARVSARRCQPPGAPRVLT